VLFNSYVFIFCFLPIVLAGYGLLRRASNPLWTITWLAPASLFYYAWWKPEFLFPLLFSVTVKFRSRQTDHRWRLVARISIGNPVIRSRF